MEGGGWAPPARARARGASRRALVLRRRLLHVLGRCLAGAQRRVPGLRRGLLRVLHGHPGRPGSGVLGPRGRLLDVVGCRPRGLPGRPSRGLHAAGRGEGPGAADGAAGSRKKVMTLSPA